MSDESIARKSADLAKTLRDIASGRVLMRVTNGVTVPVSLLVRAADVIEAVQERENIK